MKRVVLVVALAIVAALAVSSCGLARLNTPVPDEMDKVLEAYRLVETRYVDKKMLDKGALAEGAIEGMLAKLNDRFTGYLAPKDFQRAQERQDGRFQGIGATVTAKDGKPAILGLFPDSPAEKAGLKPGDVFLTIEGKPLDGLTLEEMVALIRGAEGTTVRLEMQREGVSGPLFFDIVRVAIKAVTVTFEMATSAVARIHILEFSATTGDDLKRALRDALAQRPQGLLLDLRNNPGGLVDTVIDIASQFLREGLVGYEIDADGKRIEWEVQKDGIALEIPMVVLVNGNSASGSELLSGALQDQGRAKLLGTQTYGKGSVNQTWRLKDGSGVRLTTAKWYTPKGRQIGQVGLTPDIVVALAPNNAGGDAQMQQAIRLLAPPPATGAATLRMPAYAG
ncbi:MAG: S41 family peptidase [Dehalococcoidia bacterium]|nr:S41 family peptidase [Dehalococcoidia bacterium]